MTQPNLFEWFKTSAEIIRLAITICVRYPLSLRNGEDLLHEQNACIAITKMT